MTDTRRDRARLVAVTLAVIDVVFIAFSVLSRTSEPEAVAVAVVNLVLAGVIVVLLRRHDPERRDPDHSRQVF